MQGSQNLGPLTIGLDVAIASVGWAVLGESIKACLLHDRTRLVNFADRKDTSSPENY